MLRTLARALFGFGAECDVYVREPPSPPPPCSTLKGLDSQRAYLLYVGRRSRFSGGPSPTGKPPQSSTYVPCHTCTLSVRPIQCRCRWELAHVHVPSLDWGPFARIGTNVSGTAGTPAPAAPAQGQAPAPVAVVVVVVAGPRPAPLASMRTAPMGRMAPGPASLPSFGRQPVQPLAVAPRLESRPQGSKPR